MLPVNNGQLAYPSYLCGNYFKLGLPFTANILFVKAIVWEKIAAAVFEFGRLEQSPNDHTLGYLLCLIVCLSTSTNPA